jgi:hypothetical protein
VKYKFHNNVITYAVSLEIQLFILKMLCQIWSQVSSQKCVISDVAATHVSLTWATENATTAWCGR